MKMILVAPPRPHLCEPIAVRPRLAAQSLLDRRVHEDAGDDTVFRRRSDYFGVRMGPDIAPILRDHVERQVELALRL
jgi:hypothetical protein